MAKKKISYDLYGKLQLASIEREVEDAYNNGISLFFTDSPIEHPYQCDGYLTEGLMLRLLIEYKFDEILSNAVVRAKVLVQVLFYLKQFEEGGLPLPNVIMVGDKNECFVIHSNLLVNYLDERIDWDVAPSSAAAANPRLVQKIAQDDNINPFIFEINEKFKIEIVVKQIRDLAVNVKRYVRVTEHNIAEIFDYFSTKVIRKPEELDPHTLVEIFIGILLYPMDYYQHPGNRNILVGKQAKYSIFGDAYIAFFDYYNRNYTPQERMRFTEIADRLIEDTTRRRNGEFFTPTTFVDKAHRMIEQWLGYDWKEKYVVWDNCCGTKNLTRDYRFSNLFCSTLIADDLRLVESYNEEATSFVFDFLNDDIDSVPSKLFKVLKQNKPVVFFLNPPFASSASFVAERQKEDGAYDTMVAKMMRKDKMDLAARNTVPQFLYRIMKITEEFNLTNVKIALFCNPNFLCANSFGSFRNLFFDKFKFHSGIYFCASEFADVSEKWGIAFNLWEQGIQAERNFFSHTIVERRDGQIRECQTKVIYNRDNLIDSSQWIRQIPVSAVKKDVPILSSGISLFKNPRGKSIGKLSDDSIGCYYHVASDVYHSATYVALFTGNCSHPSGKWSITRENFDRIMTVFAARKLIIGKWYDDKDVFLVPDTGNPCWNEFVSDAIVFSLFHSASNQSSLRHINYNGGIYDIKNEFFFMSRQEILSVANEKGNDVCYNDARTDSDRFVYEKLKTLDLSVEAKDLLKTARSLVLSSFDNRVLFDMEHPEYQINNWDAGWYQVKALLKQYDKKGLADFNKKFDVLSRKMIPKVYELGFLR